MPMAIKIISMLLALHAYDNPYDSNEYITSGRICFSALYFDLISKSMYHLFAFSGLLIAKKKLFRNPVPGGCGGGTVLFVSSRIGRLFP